MNRNIYNQISSIIKEEIINDTFVGGGCIADSKIITTSSGKKIFLKQGCSKQMFLCEANGLNEIKKSQTISTPNVIESNKNFLLLEYIPQGTKSPKTFQLFGEQFAKMHQYSNSAFGFYENNFIGNTPQINTPSNNWTDFYFTNRLLYQFKLAEKNKYSTPEFIKAFKKLESNIDEILKGSEENPSLLHGDLWAGNYIISSNDAPYIIDPAVYYGHREADLAMTKLFGGFTQDFYEAYNNTFPLKDGYDFRENIYLLYHVLNHLNLFGSSYYHQTLNLMNYYT
jgi:fructosamine-3-kinase